MFNQTMTKSTLFIVETFGHVTREKLGILSILRKENNETLRHILRITSAEKVRLLT